MIYRLEEEKIIEYDFCTYQKYILAIPHKVKSFQ